MESSSLTALRQSRGDSAEDNPWRTHNRVICALDLVKPLEAQRGWSLGQIQAYNRERFEGLLSATWDLAIIDEAHRLRPRPRRPLTDLDK